MSSFAFLLWCLTFTPHFVSLALAEHACVDVGDCTVENDGPHDTSDAMSLLMHKSLIENNIQKAEAMMRQPVVQPLAELIYDSVGFKGNSIVQVAVDGNSALIGSEKGGTAYIFVQTGGTWTEQARISPDTPDTIWREDRFADSLALSGDTALIGASGDRRHGSFSGAAYIFVRNGQSWTQQAKLFGHGIQRWSRFGSGVALLGETALIAASGAIGGAYIFNLDGSTWTEETKLLDVGVQSVTLAIDDTALFAVMGTSTYSEVHSFVRHGSGWTELDQIVPPVFYWSGFGSSVSLAGNTAVIGAPNHDGSKGVAYVFVRSGSTWTQQAQLTASDHYVGHTMAKFGCSVVVAGDTALIGAEGNGPGGAAYVFTRNGNAWTEQAKLTPSDQNLKFGARVAMQDDTVFIGTEPSSPAAIGKAYIYQMGCTVPEPPSGTTYVPTGCAAGQWIPHNTECKLLEKKCEVPGKCLENGYQVPDACSPSDLQVQGLCLAKWGVDYNGRYSYRGDTQSGAPYYQKVSNGNFFLYHDPECAGHSEGSPRWIFDNDRPDTAAIKDLDGDGACYYQARVNADTFSLPPVGKNPWRQYCRATSTGTGSWVTQLVQIKYAW